MAPKVVSFVGYHNSGKTTLIEKVVSELRKRGYKVGYIKHDPKGHAVTDKEGSDTHRLFSVLDKVAIISKDKTTLWEKRQDDPLSFVEEHFKDFDIVILEGWKSSRDLKKVVLGDLQVEGFIKVNNSTSLEDIICYILS